MRVYTTGAEWRLRRNAVIYTAHLFGISERLIADVFDLSPSSVHEIVEAMANCDPESEHSRIPETLERTATKLLRVRRFPSIRRRLKGRRRATTLRSDPSDSDARSPTPRPLADVPDFGDRGVS